MTAIHLAVRAQSSYNRANDQLKIPEITDVADKRATRTDKSAITEALKTVLNQALRSHQSGLFPSQVNDLLPTK